MTLKTRATIEDLYREPGKAEIVDGEIVARVYRASAPDTPTLYRRGEIAEAEPAVPGWTIPVDELFI